MNKLKESMQDQLDDAFGAGRVKVEAKEDGSGLYSLGFQTTT